MNRRLSLVSIVVILAFAELLHAQTFSNPVRIPSGQDPVNASVADLNGDGLPDLLYETSSVNSTPGTVQTLLAQASGGYAEGPTITLPLFTGACRPLDVNGDGKQDLVCINYIDSCDAQVATFLGNGDGSFQTPTYSGVMHSNCGTTDFFASMYTPADVNSDSIPDLIVGDPYNMEFFVLLGDGKGHFNVSFNPFPATVQQGGEVLVADLNGDGKPDLFTDVGPNVWLGKGDGTFTYGGNYGNYDSCNLYDIEADGHPDAICTNLFTTAGLSFVLDILHGNADGSFNTTPVSSMPLQGDFAALESPTAILDVNGDGIPDILGASSDGLSVLLGQGNLKFKSPVHYAVGTFGPVGSTTSQIVDLNHDGYKDIVCAGAGGLYISYGTKSGTYDAPAAFPVANLLGQVTVADFNGDGIPDIAATGDQGIEVSLGNGDGTFKPFTAQSSGQISFSQANDDLMFMGIGHGDFRGIGKQDLLAMGNAGTPGVFNPYLLFGNGDGTFSSPQIASDLAATWSGMHPSSIADFNNDGRDDVFGYDRPATGAVSFGVALSNGDGTFNTVTTPLPIVIGPSTPAATFPVFADFNKDGKLDAVLASGAIAYVVEGNGDGSFKTNLQMLPIPPYQGQSLQYMPLAVTTGDFDGDGNLDFAVLAQVGGYLPPPVPNTDVQSAVYVFYGNGDGTFSGPVIAGGSNELYDTIYSADLNKDGRSDLILQTTGARVEFPGNSVGAVLSQPGRLFGPVTVYTAGIMGTSGFVADLNRDGYPDILISNSSHFPSGFSTAVANSVTALLNLGPQTNPSLVPSTTNLVASSQSFVAGTSTTFTATVSGTSSSGPTPTGSVRFADQTGVESSVPLVASGNASATATFTTSMIGVGSDTMGATYSGDSTFSSSSATVPLTATGLPDSITFAVTPNPVSLGGVATFSVTVANPAGSSAATPTGYIEFYDGSTVIGGPNTLSNGSTTFNTSFAAVGQHPLSVRYSGDLIHISNTASQTETVEIRPDVSISTPPSITTAQALSAAITVSGGTGNPTPTGSVTLTAASTTSGGSVYTPPAATLINGSATINIPAGTLAAGNYALTPTYTPDAASSSIYLSASDVGDYVLVTAPTPTFTVSGTAVTVAPGATTGNTSTITITPSNGFTGSVALSASITSGPNGAQYPPTLSFGTTSSVSITGTNAGTATLTVLTTAPTKAASMFPERRDLPWYTSGGAVLACVLLFGIRPIRRSWQTMLGMLLLLVTLAGGVLACGGGGGSGSNGGGGGGTTNPGTTAGTYTVTVSGTSGAASVTSTVTLIVQ